MKKSRKSSGITLVALVVTIIVLLVLAGVSLNLISGSDGILGRASSAADRNNVAKAGEEVELLMSELQSEYFEKVYVNGDKTVTEKSSDEYVIAHLDGATTSSGFTIDVDGTKLTVKDGSDVIASNEFESSTSAKLKTGWTGDKKGKTSGGGGISTPTATTYTVTYNANAGADTVTGMPTEQSKIKGQSLTLSSETPSRNGYAFQGWATSSSGDVAYTAGGNYTTDEEVILYAKWDKSAFSVTYNANAGSETVNNMPSNQTKTKGEALTLSSSTPTRTGYVFQGWATSSSGSVEYSAGGSYLADAEVTLYAKWEVDVLVSTTKLTLTNTASRSGNVISFAYSESGPSYGYGTPSKFAYTTLNTQTGTYSFSADFSDLRWFWMVLWINKLWTS